MIVHIETIKPIKSEKGSQELISPFLCYVLCKVHLWGFRVSDTICQICYLQLVQVCDIARLMEARSFTVLVEMILT